MYTMSLLQLLCFFLERIKPNVSEEMDEGYFFFDEDTGDIHKL
jgi:hypothetical protein